MTIQVGKARRVGWRKQPTQEGRMRLSPSYKHSSGARVQLLEGGWFFTCTTADGKSLNSLWRTGKDSLFATAVDAMVAAESAMTEEVLGG